jgi:hypothetical protein
MSLKVILLSLVGLALAIQVIRPARTNPVVDRTKTIEATAQVPADVSAMLQRSCNDCHSNTTAWPWYTNVAPVSWLLVNHVNDGRRHLSLSTWGDYPAKIKRAKLDHICEHVREGEMPLSSYVLIHSNAALSPGDVQAICAWTDGEAARIPTP